LQVFLNFVNFLRGVVSYAFSLGNLYRCCYVSFPMDQSLLNIFVYFYIIWAEHYRCVVNTHSFTAVILQVGWRVEGFNGH